MKAESNLRRRYVLRITIYLRWIYGTVAQTDRSQYGAFSRAKEVS